MTRKRAFRITLGLAAAACAIAPIHASACTFMPIVELEQEGPPPDWSRQCRAATRDLAGILADRSEDPLQHYEALTVAAALHEGTFGCRKRPGRAIELVDALIGSPVGMPRGSQALRNYLEWTQDDPPPSERREEVFIGSWIVSSSLVNMPCSSYYMDELPHGRGQDEVLTLLLRPDYWEIALESFGNNPARDRMVLRQLISPASDKFDLARAAELATLFNARTRINQPDPVNIEVAEALADPRIGIPDYEAAARVLGAYSHYNWMDVSEEQAQRLGPLWTRIAQSRLTHPDEKVRREALYMLGTGDPSARPGVTWPSQVPEGSALVALEQWPKELAPLSSLGRAAARIADNYPRRALRELAGGRVELGIVFAPDGTFRNIIVTRSAGPILDEAAVRGAERYFRPRLGDLVLEGYEGRTVYVPLPAFEYRISTVLGNERAGLSGDGSKIVILGRPIRLQN